MAGLGNLYQIYQVVRAAYLDGDEERGPSASSSLLNPQFPMPESTVPPTERLIEENLANYKQAYMAPFKKTKSDIDNWMMGLMQMPAGIARSALGTGYKQQIAKLAAPLKQGATKLLRMERDKAYEAGRLKENLYDRYIETENPKYMDQANRVATVENRAIENTRRMETRIAGMVKGVRATSRALDVIPQIAMDDIESVGLSPKLFTSQATRTTMEFAPLHFDEDLARVVVHETGHGVHRSAKIGAAVDAEGLELFKRLRTSDLKTRIIDDYLPAPSFDDWKDAKPSELLVQGEIPTRFAQALTGKPGYKNNPMELHANLMGKAVAEGHITKDNFAEKFMATMQGSLDVAEADVNKMFDLMADREPRMRVALELMEITHGDDYSYQIKHDDPETAKSVQAITRQISQGKGLFGDMVWMRGEKKYVETKMREDGQLGWRQYETPWRGRETGPPTLFELNPPANRIGEPVGVSVTGSPDIAARSREHHVPRGNLLPHMQTPAIKAKLNVYDQDIKSATTPQERTVLQKERTFYEEEYARRTDPRSISRVKLNLEGDPDRTLVKAFTKEGKEALKTTYTEAMVEELAKVYKAKGALADDAVELLEQRLTQSELYKEVEDTLRLNVDGAERFNLNQTGKLQELGYKGIAYSPSRYDEYEIRVFEPEDVYAKDVRKWSRTDPSKSDPAIKRLMNASQQDRLDQWEGEARVDEEEDRWGGGSLRNIYKQVDLRDVIYRAIQRAYGKETN